MGTATNAAKKPLTFAEIKMANAILEAAKKDFSRPEVQVDFEQWKKEQAAKARQAK